MKRVAAMVLGALFCAGTVQAGTVYELTFSTTGTGTIDYPLGAQEHFEFPWSGTVRIETVSGADGVYSNLGLVSLIFSANLGRPYQVSFATYGDPSVPFPSRPATVTVEDGRVAGVQVGYSEGSRSFVQSVSLRGLIVDYSGSFAAQPFGALGQRVSATATLVPAIPEPSTTLLTSVGLLALAAPIGLSRRRRVIGSGSPRSPFDKGSFA